MWSPASVLQHQWLLSPLSLSHQPLLSASQPPYLLLLGHNEHLCQFTAAPRNPAHQMRSLNSSCWRKVAGLIPATACRQQRFWRVPSLLKPLGSLFRKGPLDRLRKLSLHSQSPLFLAWTQSRYQASFPGPTQRVSLQKPCLCLLHLDRDVRGFPL